MNYKEAVNSNPLACFSSQYPRGFVKYDMPLAPLTYYSPFRYTWSYWERGRILMTNDLQEIRSFKP